MHYYVFKRFLAYTSDDPHPQKLSFSHPSFTFHTGFKEKIRKTKTQSEMFPFTHRKEECFTLSPQNSIHLKSQSGVTDFYSYVRLQIPVSCDL